MKTIVFCNRCKSELTAYYSIEDKEFDVNDGNQCSECKQCYCDKCFYEHPYISDLKYCDYNEDICSDCYYQMKAKKNLCDDCGREKYPDGKCWDCVEEELGEDF